MRSISAFAFLLALSAWASTAVALPSWWSDRNEPPLESVTGTLLQPEAVEVVVWVWAPGNTRERQRRSLKGWEAIAYLVNRDYVVFDWTTGLYATTQKYRVWKDEHVRELPKPPSGWGPSDIKHGTYHYGGSRQGYAFVTVKDPNTIEIALEWKPTKDQYVVTAARSGPGRYVGHYYVKKNTTDNPATLPIGPIGIAVRYDPATGRAAFTDTPANKYNMNTVILEKD